MAGGARGAGTVDAATSGAAIFNVATFNYIRLPDLERGNVCWIR